MHMMKSIFFAAFVFVSANLFAEEAKTTVELSQGYVRDNLRFTVSRPNHPEKGTDRYKDVDIYMTRLGYQIEKHGYFLKARAGYGQVYDGKFHQTDHFKGRTYFTGRFEEQNTKKAHITDNYIADFLVTFGKTFDLCHGWSLAPSLGYGVYIEKYKTSRGKVHSIEKHDDVKSHHKHHGTKEDIDATWYSPEIGLVARKTFTDTLSAHAGYQFLFPLNYDAKGHSNTKNPSKTKFDQENKAYKSFGNIAQVGFDWKFLKGWSFKPEVEVLKFYAKGGDSHHHYRLHRATRSAFEVRLVLGYSF